METTLPASWYRSPELYELERRAIFSKYWLLTSHSAQFNAPGKYVRFEMAGYSFFIIRDRRNNINAFFNVCRHRAFPLIEKDSGTANILACKYHGWSYGIGGQLAKAPRFEAEPDFDKDEYNLFKIHTHIDKCGFIWVNFDSADVPAISWEKQNSGMNERPGVTPLNVQDYVYEETWTMDAKFNWKTLIDNYNECYHCSVAHPGIAAFLTPKTKYDVTIHDFWIEHQSSDERKNDGSTMGVKPAWVWPSASFLIHQDMFYMMSIVPKSATECTMRYEFYRSPKSQPEAYQTLVDFFKQVETEDKYLSNGAQTNLSSDVYVVGPLHSYMEKTLRHVKNVVRQALLDHREEESKAGRELWPARRVPKKNSQVSTDEDFRNSLCAILSEKFQQGCPPKVAGSAMLAYAATEEEVTSRMKRDCLVTGGVWDAGSIDVYPFWRPNRAQPS